MADRDTGMALKELLERRGVLGPIRAKIRAEIFKSIDHNRREGQQRKKPASDLEFLINELIREYLLFHQMDATEHVFAMESGQGESHLARAMLARELGLVDADGATRMPLLCSLVTKLRKVAAATVTTTLAPDG